MKPAIVALMALPLAAQTQITLKGSLENQVRALAGAPAWIGYTVPGVPGQHQTCDGAQGLRAPGPVHLEPVNQVNILYRVEGGKVVKVRALSPDCTLDAGRLPFYWLQGVRPGESVAYLEQMPAEGSIAALALHAAPEADTALEKMTAADQPFARREKAVFWMGAARGARGFEDLKRMVAADPDSRLRDKAVFALFVGKQPGAADELIRVARQDQSSHVRGQALFWLAQLAGRKAAAAITDAIANDPETEVKKRAVFALQQLPGGEGIPLLIQVARTNRNPAVRKQAMFWLGQSHDPRAVDFFEQVLK